MSDKQSHEATEVSFGSIPSEKPLKRRRSLLERGLAQAEYFAYSFWMYLSTMGRAISSIVSNLTNIGGSHILGSAILLGAISVVLTLISGGILSPFSAVLANFGVTLASGGTFILMLGDFAMMGVIGAMIAGAIKLISKAFDYIYYDWMGYPAPEKATDSIWQGLYEGTAHKTSSATTYGRISKADRWSIERGASTSHDSDDEGLDEVQPLLAEETVATAGDNGEWAIRSVKSPGTDGSEPDQTTENLDPEMLKAPTPEPVTDPKPAVETELLTESLEKVLQKEQPADKDSEPDAAQMGTSTKPGQLISVDVS